eukprot:CAMPEP_0170640690 /NCGR_PEP_ID=MMETSP0224-20130122/40364_1 /TAXON_ID=285029 /ORGANISM="Togula jolla, Strain CCCM 725" /LENGTH=36 /DNA_ID= /DNA_START= /DNA_END= /DNA_ORIENTATION=
MGAKFVANFSKSEAQGSTLPEGTGVGVGDSEAQHAS